MRKYLFPIICIVLILGACGKKQSDSKNIEQIQAEQGIPVRQIEIKNTVFKQELTYNAVLSGIEESTAKAMVSDIIVSINAKVGDRVKKGQTIVSFPRNTPAAQYEQANTAFNSIKQVYERMQRLHAQGAISQQDLDNAETQYKVSKSNLDASRMMIEVSAPIDGIITNVIVNPSEHVFPGADLFTVSNTNSYKAILWIPETEIKHIKQGTRATATWNEESIGGKVTQISMALDPNNKAFRVEAVFANTNRKFAPGITAEIKLDILSKSNAIVVDRQYIVSENGKRFVWVNTDGKATKREIEIGLDNQLQFEIIAGLQAGDILLTEGINQLSENSKLLVIE